MSMLRAMVLTAAVGALCLAGGRSSWALDQKVGSGVAGRAVSIIGVASGAGRSAEDGLARPGVAAVTHTGSVGVTSGGSKGNTNLASDEGFHAAGMGKSMTAGVGRSTNDTVPGRAPAYVHMVEGKRAEPTVGGRGP